MEETKDIKEDGIKQDNLEKRKEKIKSWLKDPYNLALIGILIFAFALRLYYFILTKNQPLWWDEAEYMSTAKSFAGIINFDFHWALNRFPGFPFLVSLFYMVGINDEVTLRFLLAFVPSILAIILMYYVLTSMYSDKKIALISIAIFSVLWEHVFYSNRFHTENLSLIFEFLAIIVLFRVYLKNQDLGFIKSKYSLLWIVLFSILSILFRSGNIAFIPAIALFLIIIKFYKLPNKLKIPAFVTLVSLGLISIFSLKFLAKNSQFINFFYHYESPLGWNSFSAFYGFYQSLVPSIPSILFYAFIFGAIIVIGRIIIFPEGLKKVNKNIEDNSYKADIFNLILISAILFFFVVILKTSTFEYRWFFAFLPGLFAFTAKGLITVGNFVQKTSRIKGISTILILLLLGAGLYTQWQRADMIVKYKINSYEQVKDSGLWLKENSNPEDAIVSASLTQHRYYAERNILDFYVNGSNENESAFNEKILEYKPKYLVISAFEPAFTPKWAYDWPQRHNDSVIPVQVYFADAEKKQAVLVIYQFNNRMSTEK